MITDHLLRCPVRSCPVWDRCRRGYVGTPPTGWLDPTPSPDKDGCDEYIYDGRLGDACEDGASCRLS